MDTCIVDTCIVDACIVDTCIMDTCIVDTCIMDTCIMDTCIMDTICGYNNQNHGYMHHGHICMGHTAWAPEGREGQSQAGPKGPKPTRRASKLLVHTYWQYDIAYLQCHDSNDSKMQSFVSGWMLSFSFIRHKRPRASFDNSGPIPRNPSPYLGIYGR